MELGIVKTSWTTVILPPYSSSIILGYLIYRKTFAHSDSFKVIARLTSGIIDNHPSITGNTFFSIKSTLSKILGLNVPVIPTDIFFSILT